MDFFQAMMVGALDGVAWPAGPKGPERAHLLEAYDYALKQVSDQELRLKATDDSNVEAALRKLSAAAGEYRNETEPNRRVATQWIEELARRLRDNRAVYGNRPAGAGPWEQR